MYLTVFIMCLTQYSFWMYQLSDDSLKLFVPISNNDALKVMLSHKPECLKNRGILTEWAGGTIYWIVCEILIHITYVITLVFLMAKSRFFSVGIDNTQQFQPTYLSFLANYII